MIPKPPEGYERCWTYYQTLADGELEKKKRDYCVEAIDMLLKYNMIIDILEERQENET